MPKIYLVTDSAANVVVSTGDRVFTGYLLQAEKGTFALANYDGTLLYDYHLAAETGVFSFNPATLGFGSFVPSVPTTQLFWQKPDGRYLTSSGAYVEVDILEGAALTRDMESEWEVTRVAVVTNLNSGHTLDGPGIQVAAVAAVVEVVGDRGSRCPSIADPTYLARFQPELMDEHSAKVKIIYRSYPVPQYEFDSNLGQVETNIDRNGDVIVTGYTYPAGYTLNPANAGKTRTQGGLVQTPIAEASITVKFSITAGYLPAVILDGSFFNVTGYVSATTILTALQRLEGRVNSGALAISNLSGGARCWMVTKVNGRSKDGGRTYDASITLQLKRDGWDSMVTFINPDDGKPPADLVAGSGYYRPEILLECTPPTWLFTNPYMWVKGSDWTWE